MKVENNIGWCDETGNKVTGCTKVSPGCSRCYAAVGTRARVLRAQGIETWGPKGQRYPVKDFATKVRRLNKLCVCDKCHDAFKLTAMPEMFGRKHGLCGGTLRRIRLFADSNSDWLDDKWPIETLADLLKDIHDCPNVDFQLLTKRPDKFESRIDAAFEHSHGEGWQSMWAQGEPPENVWLGVSVEDQKRADERIPLLLQIPAKVRFLSVEPLLEKVDLRFERMEIEGGRYTAPCKDGARPPARADRIHWVIVGGESGKDRRDCGVEAICDVARQCVAAGVKCFVKQDCAFKPGQKGRLPDDVWALKQFPS